MYIRIVFVSYVIKSGNYIMLNLLNITSKASHIYHVSMFVTVNTYENSFIQYLQIHPRFVTVSKVTCLAPAVHPLLLLNGKGLHIKHAVSYSARKIIFQRPTPAELSGSHIKCRPTRMFGRTPCWCYSQ